MVKGASHNNSRIIMGVAVENLTKLLSSINSNFIAIKRVKITNWHLRFVKIIFLEGAEWRMGLN